MRTLILVLITVAASACSWQQAYSAAQGYQRNACNRLVEQTEHDRCLASTGMSYDTYQRQAKKE